MNEVIYQSFYTLDDCEEIIEILSINKINFRIHKEAQTGLKVYTGENLIPEIHIMVDVNDIPEIERILEEESPATYTPEEIPQQFETAYNDSNLEDTENPAPVWMLVIGYLLCIFGSLIGLIFALRLVMLKTDVTNPSGAYHYDKRSREHGWIMTGIALIQFIVALTYIYSG